jgi:hypothetical protein
VGAKDRHVTLLLTLATRRRTPPTFALETTTARFVVGDTVDLSAQVTNPDGTPATGVGVAFAARHRDGPHVDVAATPGANATFTGSLQLAAAGVWYLKATILSTPQVRSIEKVLVHSDPVGSAQ